MFFSTLNFLHDTIAFITTFQTLSDALRQAFFMPAVWKSC